MSIGLLGLFFDGEYHHNTSCSHGECDLSSAFDHYIEHAREECIPPNEYFASNNKFLHKDKDTDKTQCIVSDWLDKPLSFNIETNKDAIKSYMVDLLKNKKVSHIQNFISKFLAESPTELELFFCKALIDNNLIAAFNQKPTHQLNEQTVKYLEGLPSSNKSKDNILSIVLNYAAKYATDDTHAKFLSEELKTNSDFSKKFLSAIKQKEAPLDDQSLQRNGFLLEALDSSIDHCLDAENITFVKQAFDELLNKGHSDKFIGQYKKQFDKFNNFLNEKHVLSTKAQIEDYSTKLNKFNQKLSLFTTKLEEFIENHAKLPSGLLDEIINSSLELVKVTDESLIIKNIIFITLRLFQQHAELPKDTLSYFAKFLSSQDQTIQRLSLNLYKKLSVELPVDNIDVLLILAENGDMDTKRDVNEILENTLKNNATLEHEINQKLEHERNRRNSNNIIQKIRDKNLDSWSAEKEEVLKLQLHRLFTFIDWPLNLVSRLTEQLENSNIKEFERAIWKIYDYSMSHRLINRNGNNIVEIIEQQEPAEWVASIRKLYDENNYYTASTVEELVDKISLGNIKLNDDQKKYLKEQLIKIDKFTKENNLSSWSDGDFLNWRKQINHVDDDNIGEVLAVLKEVVHQTSYEQYYPRDVQVMSVLMLFKSDKGMLAQIGTGEGKSVIVSMFAAIKVLAGHHIDIITSSLVLAQRDVKEQGAFYRKLGITVSHNIRAANDNNSALKECYNSDVIYGDILNFIADYLNDINDNVKNGRGFDILIVDEVDNMFIDETGMKVLRGNHIPGIEHLRKILVYIWSVQNAIMQRLIEGTDGNYYHIQQIAKQNNTDNTDSLDDVEFIYTKVENVEEYVHNVTMNFMIDESLGFNALRNNRVVILPKHIEPFVKEQLSNWIDASMDASVREENVTYVVRNQNYYNKSLSVNNVIAPVEQDTGVIQFSLNWGDGLSQFLQIKHGLRLTPETLISIFQSYVSYFLKYKGDIYGLTGTLGTESHKEFLHKIYDVDFVEMPNFIEKKLAIFPEIITHGDQGAWLSNITEIVQHKAIEDKRAVLIIAKNIEQMQKIADYLRAKGHVGVKEYGGNLDQSIMEKPWVAGDIVVATNLAGRGTDIEISKEVEQNGGLHVTLAFFPQNSVRVEEQAFGRAARKGESGSAQLVTYENDALSDLEYKRTIKEYKTLKNDELCKIPHMLVHDDLFYKLVDLIRANDSPTKLEVICLYNNPDSISLLNNQAGVYIKDGEIYIRVGKKSWFGEFNVSLELKNIDENIYNHILSILQKPNNPTTLNKRDLEAIHFLLAKYEYSSEGSVVIKRVAEKYRSLWSINENELSTEATTIWNADRGYLTNILSFFSTSSDQLGTFPLREVVYLESLLKQDANKPETITKGAMLNAKLKKLYKLWLDDREIYSQQFEILQVHELWAMWLKAQEKMISSQNQCDLLANKNLTGNYLHAIKLDHENLERKLLESFQNFSSNITSSWKNDTIFENPAYVIRKAYDRQNVHDYQVTIEKAISSVITFLDTAFRSVGFSLGEFWYERSPLETAITLLTTAITMDPEHSWMAHNGLAYMDLVKTSPNINDAEHFTAAFQAKQRFIDYLSSARANLHEVAIEQAESLHAFILIYNITGSHSDLSRQQNAHTEILQAIDKNIERNINMTLSVLNSNHMIRVKSILAIDSLVSSNNIINDTEARPNHMIRVSNSLVIEELHNKSNATDDLNITTADRQSISSLNAISGDFNTTIYKEVTNALYMSGALAFEIEIYELEEDDDWFGTVFSFVLGIGQIFLGIALIGMGGPFLTAFGTSLVLGGAGDILSSVISVMEGMPIDMSNYLKSKAINLAVSVVVSVIAYVGNAIAISNGMSPLIKAIDLSRQGATMNFVIQQFGFQLVMLGTSTVIQNAGNQYLNSNDGVIENEIKDDINALLISYYEDLKKIFASDAKEGTHLVNELIRDAGIISSNYAKRFNSNFAQGVKSVGPSAVGTLGAVSGGGIGAIAGIVAGAGFTAVNVGMGVIKVSEATDDFTDKFSQAIKNVASKATVSTKQIMQRQLENSFTGHGAPIMQLLGTHGFLLGADIDYKNCNHIENFDLQSYKDKLDAIRSACVQIANLMGDGYMSPKREELSAILQSLLLANIKGIIKSDIISPIASYGGSIAGNYAREAIKNHQDEKIRLQFKKMQDEIKAAQSKATDNAKHNEGYSKTPPKEHDSWNKPGTQSGSCPGDGAGVCSAGDSSKGKKIYDNPIGPNEPFIDDYHKVEAKIDMMPISDDEKLTYKNDAYKVIKNLYSMSDEQKVELADYIKKQFRERDGWDRIKEVVWIPEANALMPLIIAGVMVTPELLLAFTALTGTTYIVLTDAIGKTSEFLKHESDKANILSTPIHEDKGTIHSTPVHENKGDIEGYSTPEYLSKLPGFEPTTDGFKLPGFEVHVGDDLKILYKDGVGVDHYEYWDKNVEFKGNKVYQRDDLIDPNRVDKATGLTNLELMQGKTPDGKSRAPKGPDGKPINIHHLIQTQEGGLAEITAEMHQKYHGVLHIDNNKVPSKIDRIAHDKWRAEYWRNRAKDFEKGVKK